MCHYYNLLPCINVVVFSEVICDRLDIQNAVNHKLYKLKYKKDERATYGCNEGYKGNPSRMCGENGWIGNSECTGKKVQKNKIIAGMICWLYFVFTCKNLK